MAHDHVDVGGLFAKALVRVSREFVRAKRQVRNGNVFVVWQDLTSIFAHFGVFIKVVPVIAIGARRLYLVRFGSFIQALLAGRKALIVDELLLAETGGVEADLVPHVILLLVLAATALAQIGRHLLRYRARVIRLGCARSDLLIYLLIVEWIFVIFHIQADVNVFLVVISVRSEALTILGTSACGAIPRLQV